MLETPIPDICGCCLVYCYCCHWQADARPALGTQARMVIHEGAPTAKVITLEEIQNRRQLVSVQRCNCFGFEQLCSSDCMMVNCVAGGLGERHCRIADAKSVRAGGRNQGRTGGAGKARVPGSAETVSGIVVFLSLRSLCFREF